MSLSIRVKTFALSQINTEYTRQMAIRILANDGIHAAGLQKLQDHGFEVVTDRINQADLPTQLNEFDAILVRSATKVRQELIDGCSRLRAIGRGGVGMDNIDVAYARDKGLDVFNTPAASSLAVAELAIGHIASLARGLHTTHAAMPERGASEFKALKKGCAKGMQLQGKKLGIIGFGRIGQALAKIGLGLGMEILPVDLVLESASIKFDIQGQALDINVKTVALDDMLAQADFISVHVPSTDKPLLGAAQFDQMKDGVCIINTARGTSIDEDALLAALNSGKVRGAGLDVFVNEPTPRTDLLQHPSVSASPHIGASTIEAQALIGIELADNLIRVFGSQN